MHTESRYRHAFVTLLWRALLVPTGRILPDNGELKTTRFTRIVYQRRQAYIAIISLYSFYL